MKHSNLPESNLTTTMNEDSGGQKKTMIKVKQHKQFSVGLHLVTIKDIRLARKYNKNGSLEIIADKETGECKAIEVIFENDKKKLYSGIFWLSENGRWLINNLCKTVNVDNTNRQPNKSELIGKSLWIIVAGVYKVINGIRIEPNYDTQLVYKFFPNLGSRPALTGDPVYGPPSRYFVIEKIIDVPINEFTGKPIKSDVNFLQRNFGDD